MKKILSIFGVFVLTLTIIGCSSENDNDNDNKDNDPNVVDTRTDREKLIDNLLEDESMANQLLIDSLEKLDDLESSRIVYTYNMGMNIDGESITSSTEILNEHFKTENGFIQHNINTTSFNLNEEITFEYFLVQNQDDYIVYFNTPDEFNGFINEIENRIPLGLQGEWYKFEYSDDLSGLIEVEILKQYTVQRVVNLLMEHENEITEIGLSYQSLIDTLQSGGFEAIFEEVYFKEEIIIPILIKCLEDNELDLSELGLDVNTIVEKLETEGLEGVFEKVYFEENIVIPMIVEWLNENEIELVDHGLDVSSIVLTLETEGLESVFNEIYFEENIIIPMIVEWLNENEIELVDLGLNVTNIITKLENDGLEGLFDEVYFEENIVIPMLVEWINENEVEITGLGLNVTNIITKLENDGLEGLFDEVYFENNIVIPILVTWLQENEQQIRDAGIDYDSALSTLQTSGVVAFLEAYYVDFLDFIIESTEDEELITLWNLYKSGELDSLIEDFSNLPESLDWYAENISRFEYLFDLDYYLTVDDSVVSYSINNDNNITAEINITSDLYNTVSEKVYVDLYNFIEEAPFLETNNFFGDCNSAQECLSGPEFTEFKSKLSQLGNVLIEVSFDPETKEIYHVNIDLKDFYNSLIGESTDGYLLYDTFNIDYNITSLTIAPRLPYQDIVDLNDISTKAAKLGLVALTDKLLVMGEEYVNYYELQSTSFTLRDLVEDYDFDLLCEDYGFGYENCYNDYEDIRELTDTFSLDQSVFTYDGTNLTLDLKYVDKVDVFTKEVSRFDTLSFSDTGILTEQELEHLLVLVNDDNFLITRLLLMYF